MVAVHASSPAALRPVSLSALPPLALYVHIPWCARKCPYCDFNSHEARGGLPEGEYAAALVQDLELARPLVWGRRVYSVFFGGGTPSLFSPETIDWLLSQFRALAPLAPGAEVTLEANPGTVEAGKFAGFRAAGVNRISLGIQSFNPACLKAIGRIHDYGEAKRAAELALEHFDNVNLDLMYALPGQSVEEACKDIETAVAFRPQHISAYHLTIEPNTYFHRYPPALPSEEEAAEMQAAIEEVLAGAGYRHYETSAFARPGFECRHNLNYWRFGDYLGIGAGAHGKLSFPERVLRQMRYKQPKAYMEKVEAGMPVQEEHEVTPEELAFEFMMNALRLNAGFPIALFEERTRLPIAAVEKGLAQAQRRGLLERDSHHVRPTALGRRFLNDLLQIFLPEQEWS